MSAISGGVAQARRAWLHVVGIDPSWTFPADYTAYEELLDLFKLFSPSRFFLIGSRLRFFA
ncbi:MAG: hypothetical protein R3E66_09180 [bacterium]